MTVKELREKLEELEKKGKGGHIVVWQCLYHVWDIELREAVKTGDVPVILINS